MKSIKQKSERFPSHRAQQKILKYYENKGYLIILVVLLPNIQANTVLLISTSLNASINSDISLLDIETVPFVNNKDRKSVV